MRARVLEAIRRKLGPPPRRIAPSAREYQRIVPPSWCDRSDALSEVYRLQERLFAEGELTWGVTVQANSQLFEAGTHDCPAMALYGVDVDDEVFTLREIARELFALKGTEPGDPAERRFARVITDEMERAMRLAVPKTRSRGLELYTTTVMVHRKHLPQGRLTSNAFPLLTLPSAEATLILPSRYWSDRLLVDWGERVGAPG